MDGVHDSIWLTGEPTQAPGPSNAPQRLAPRKRLPPYRFFSASRAAAQVPPLQAVVGAAVVAVSTLAPRRRSVPWSSAETGLFAQAGARRRIKRDRQGCSSDSLRPARGIIVPMAIGGAISALVAATPAVVRDLVCRPPPSTARLGLILLRITRASLGTTNLTALTRSVHPLAFFGRASPADRGWLARRAVLVIVGARRARSPSRPRRRRARRRPAASAIPA